MTTLCIVLAGLLFLLPRLSGGSDFSYESEMSQTRAPPFLPFPSSSPVVPSKNKAFPKLSGRCPLDLGFASAQNIMSVTATNCWGFFAELATNITCCPQVEAMIAIFIGQYSKQSDLLALHGSVSNHCLSDIEQILVGQGAVVNTLKFCAIKPSNLTEGSCPVKGVERFERIVNSSSLLSACKNVDAITECCKHTCRNSILEAASTIALDGVEDRRMRGLQNLSDANSERISDCKNVVFRWLASRLDTSEAKNVSRVLSACSVNKVCPLMFPSKKHVINSCGNAAVQNLSGCCNAMSSYLSHLQKQSLLTNLQAWQCATVLGLELQRSISNDIYALCSISLKDFSLQVDQQESGCLLQSLPFDATYDNSSGLSFICDLNDNIPAQWPTSPVNSPWCSRSVEIPALPTATSAQIGMNDHVLWVDVLFAALVLVLCC